MAYDTLASEESIQKVLAALPTRNITGYVVANKEEALLKAKSLIPDGSEVMTGASVTLEQIGFVNLLKSGAHPWKNWKETILAEKDPVKQGILRKQASLSQYFLGSVHAITEDGQAVIGSNSGSQLPSYAFTSDNVIWIAGTQKIVPTLEEGFKRIREYVVPLEDVHMKELYGYGTNLSKMLVFSKEIMPTRRIHLILVQEKLGF
ncbi:lactate utilization protein [Candidatus Kaiserbacteria bacterium]|nr:lactate utilization protein [Candidatus Kaiserbacteria bacterium]